jgi:hypothetical protein
MEHCCSNSVSSSKWPRESLSEGSATSCLLKQVMVTFICEQECTFKENRCAWKLKCSLTVYISQLTTILQNGQTCRNVELWSQRCYPTQVPQLPSVSGSITPSFSFLPSFLLSFSLSSSSSSPPLFLLPLLLLFLFLLLLLLYLLLNGSIVD